ncbi:MAG: hypothetical protein KDC70_00015 [Saprospiraceae bacterium]|nr:hypothetical protein [Saprospiraceae bacterium]
MNDQHTPGKWVTSKGGRTIRVDDPENGQIICAGLDRRDGEFENWENNRRLIEAAPEILGALKKLTMMARTSGGTAGPDAGLMEACAEAEAAISKAEPKPDEQ